MKLFERHNKPEGFDKKCKEPGDKWVRENPKPDPIPKGYRRELPSHWTKFAEDVRIMFRGICGYSFMYDASGGSIDHYISQKTDEDLAYEWTNYRLAMERINKSKQNKDDQVLDPFDADDAWIDVQLPSMQYRTAKDVPEPFKGKIDFMLEHMKLINDEALIRPRRMWFNQYLLGKLTIEGLREYAPVLARAAEKLTADEFDKYKKVANEYDEVERQKELRRRLHRSGGTAT